MVMVTTQGGIAAHWGFRDGQEQWIDLVPEVALGDLAEQAGWGSLESRVDLGSEASQDH
jgi:hypothetical protein